MQITHIILDCFKKINANCFGKKHIAQENRDYPLGFHVFPSYTPRQCPGCRLCDKLRLGRSIIIFRCGLWLNQFTVLISKTNSRSCINSRGVHVFLCSSTFWAHNVMYLHSFVINVNLHQNCCNNFDAYRFMFFKVHGMYNYIKLYNIYFKRNLQKKYFSLKTTLNFFKIILTIVLLSFIM